MIWRKAVFALCFFHLMQTCEAQIDKGTLMTGGSLGFQYTTDHEAHVNTATFNLNPVFGGFAARNFVLGVAPLVMYTSSTGSYSYNDTIAGKPQTVVVSLSTHQTSLGLGPFARYYIRIGPKVYLFIHGSPSIMATWAAQAGSPTQRTISATWVLGPGISVMLTRSVAIEASLYYQGIYHRLALFENGNLLGNPGTPYVDNGMVFNVGFQVYLERKKKETPVQKTN